MYIQPYVCPNCSQTGYPGEQNLNVSSSQDNITIHCSCGQSQLIPKDKAKDLMIMSSNSFARLSAASNYTEYGIIETRIGSSVLITFRNKIEFPCKAYFTPQNSFALMREISLTPESMIVICASPPDTEPDNENVFASWIIQGLTNIASLQTWYIHFFSGITHIENGLYKAAILDYSSALETFLEAFLADKLTEKYDEEISNYLLQRSWKVEERCKQILEICTGHRLSEHPEVYQPWDRYVRNTRNRLAHGDTTPINRADTDLAHQATYRAIRWIQDLH